MRKLIIAVAVAGYLFFGMGIAGGVGAWRLDSTRPENVDAYSYYVERLESTSGADRAKVALAYEWAEVTGEISEAEYEELETLYKSLREG